MKPYVIITLCLIAFFSALTIYNLIVGDLIWAFANLVMVNVQVLGLKIELQNDD